MSTLNVTNISDGTNSTSTTNVVQGSAKAWVNFDGTGTPSIREAYNVSSITDNGTGDYTVNLTTALADANYACVGASGTNGTTATSGRSFQPNTSSPSTTSFRFSIRLTDNNMTNFDDPLVYVAIFR